MKILVICESFGLGGTERAACVWATGLSRRGHNVRFLAGSDGPRRSSLEEAGVDFVVVGVNSQHLSKEMDAFAPDVVHEHVPGFLRSSNLGLEGRRLARPVPLLQTNVFGRQDEMLHYGASGITSYISNTSAAQSFARASRPIIPEAFDTQTVIPYPVDEHVGADAQAVAELRSKVTGGDDNVFIIGRFGRPDWQKWSKLYEPICHRTFRLHPQVRFLFQAAPRELESSLRASPVGKACLFLPPTSNDRELAVSIEACDAILHLSRIGESFGLSIAEAMRAGKPIIVNSSPDFDQAQLELIRHKEEGFHASTTTTAVTAIGNLVGSLTAAGRLGAAAKRRIKEIAGAEGSILKLERLLLACAGGQSNPFSKEDYRSVLSASESLARAELGHTKAEFIALGVYKLRGCLRDRFHHLRVN